MSVARGVQSLQMSTPQLYQTKYQGLSPPPMISIFPAGRKYVHSYAPVFMALDQADADATVTVAICECERLCYAEQVSYTRMTQLPHRLGLSALINIDPLLFI
jgi:hypothetical protein